MQKDPKTLALVRVAAAARILGITVPSVESAMKAGKTQTRSHA